MSDQKTLILNVHNSVMATHTRPLNTQAALELARRALLDQYRLTFGYAMLSERERRDFDGLILTVSDPATLTVPGGLKALAFGLEVSPATAKRRLAVFRLAGLMAENTRGPRDEGPGSYRICAPVRTSTGREPHGGSMVEPHRPSMSSESEPHGGSMVSHTEAPCPSRARAVSKSKRRESLKDSLSSERSRTDRDDSRAVAPVVAPVRRASTGDHRVENESNRAATALVPVVAKSLPEFLGDVPPDEGDQPLEDHHPSRDAGRSPDLSPTAPAPHFAARGHDPDISF
jgi:hypothetical protein